MLAGAVALVCGIAGAFGYEQFFGDNSNMSQGQKNGSSNSAKAQSKDQSGGSSRKESKGSDESETGSASNQGDTIPGFTTADDADSLRMQIGHLSQRLDALQNRIESVGHAPDQTPPDLHTLQIKMVEFSRTMDDVAALPSRVRRFGNRLETLEQEIKMLRDQVKEADDRDLNRSLNVLDQPPGRPAVVPPTMTPLGNPGAGDPAAEGIDAPDAALDQAIALVRLGQYALAANMLASLRVTEPNDARVWYFSAIINGLTTGRWDGTTQKYAEQGLERERAGTLSRSLIDRSLQGISPTQGSNWLGGFRQRIGKKS